MFAPCNGTAYKSKLTFVQIVIIITKLYVINPANSSYYKKERNKHRIVNIFCVPLPSHTHKTNVWQVGKTINYDVYGRRKW